MARLARLLEDRRHVFGERHARRRIWRQRCDEWRHQRCGGAGLRGGVVFVRPLAIPVLSEVPVPPMDGLELSGMRFNARNVSTAARPPGDGPALQCAVDFVAACRGGLWRAAIFPLARGFAGVISHRPAARDFAVFWRAHGFYNH